MDKLEHLTQQFGDAVEELDKVLKQEKNEFIRDSAIKRFEISFDLAWKTLKAYLEKEKGLVCHSPKDCFRQAYQVELIEYDDFWLEMTDKRNETVHAYDEKLANEIFEILPKTLKFFQQLLASIKK